MILLSINFNSFLSQVIGPKQASNPENMQLSVIGRFYKKLFAWLAGEIERIAQAESEITAIKQSAGIYQVLENGKAYETHITGFCSCQQYNCNHAKYIKSLNGKLPQAKTKIKSPALRKLANREISRAWELVEF